MHASNAVDAYANLIDTESISKTIKTEDEWNRLIQSYIDRFGYEFVIEAVRNYRGREDLKKGEKYAMATRHTLAKVISMTESKEELLEALVSLYESDPDEVLRKVSVPFALSGIFYDDDLEKFTLSPAASMLKKQDDLPIQFIGEYMYERPADAVMLMAEVFGTSDDKQMVAELANSISQLWRRRSWPDGVTSAEEATSRAQELLLSIAGRKEWWLQMFLKRVLDEKPEWSNPALKDVSDMTFSSTIIEPAKAVVEDRTSAFNHDPKPINRKPIEQNSEQAEVVEEAKEVSASSVRQAEEEPVKVAHIEQTQPEEQKRGFVLPVVFGIIVVLACVGIWFFRRRG
ncbi:MAG: hypothetical protein ACOX52_08370 [Verrucomicrobiota bacterium]